METLSLKRLGLFPKPMIVLNSYGFYDPLIDLLEAMLDNHFLGPRHREMWTIVGTPAEILPAVAANAGWDPEARSFALVQ
jgi:predicted Rossmann-fold nucleotide-binding protein